MKKGGGGALGLGLLLGGLFEDGVNNSEKVGPYFLRNADFSLIPPKNTVVY